MGAWIRWLKDLWLGKRALGLTVERATAVPATGNLFAVNGGKIMLMELVGTITVVMNAVATAVKLNATPTQGTARDICTVTDIQGFQVGDLLGIPGGVIGGPGALQPAAGNTSGAISGMTTPMIIQAGFIGMNLNAPGTTGSVRWTLKYLPIDAGATVTAV